MSMYDRYDEISDRTIDLLGLAHVKRWGVIKMLRDQSVAEHSFNVAVISLEIVDRLGLVSPSVAFVSSILMWSLFHDVPETMTGDIDGKFKRDFPAVSETVRLAERDLFPWYRFASDTVTDPVRWIVKLADMIEAMAYIQEWGHGVRADDVAQELKGILAEEVIPKVAEALDVPVDDIAAVARQILDHSVRDYNCIQLRRHRQSVPNGVINEDNGEAER